MWSHYAKNHTGFCIAYEHEKFKRSNLYGAAGEVTYTDYYPKIDPINEHGIKEMFIESHTKASEWSYEKEFRLVRVWDEANPSTEDRIIRVSEDFIHEIILGLNISDSDKHEIVAIARQRNIPISLIIKKKRAFLLDKVPI